MSCAFILYWGPYINTSDGLEHSKRTEALRFQKELRQLFRRQDLQGEGQFGASITTGYAGHQLDLREERREVAGAITGAIKDFPTFERSIGSYINLVVSILCVSMDPQLYGVYPPFRLDDYDVEAFAFWDALSLIGGMEHRRTGLCLLMPGQVKAAYETLISEGFVVTLDGLSVHAMQSHSPVVAPASSTFVLPDGEEVS